MFSFKNSPLLDVSLFVRRHGVSPLDSHPRQFEELEQLRLADVGPGAVRLTPKEIACLFEPQRPDAADFSPAEANLVRKHNYAPTYTRRS